MSARVIVAIAPAPVAVAEQLTNPLPSTIVGDDGTEKPAEKVVVIVSPLFKAPDALVVKLAVQRARARATRLVELTLTALTEVCGVIVTEAALAAAESALVLMVSTEPPVVLVFVMPEIATAAAALSGSVHVPPKSASVTVATVPVPETVAEQFVKPLSCTPVAVDVSKPAEKLTVIVSKACSDPVAVDVKPAVHFAVLLAPSDVELMLTGVGEVAAVITGATPTLAAVLSGLVLTVQLAAAGAPAAPLVTPRI